MKIPIQIIALTIVSACLALNEVSYSFQYSIDDMGVISHQKEERKGDSVHGVYTFLQPNGLVRVVEYRVEGKKGFKASVQFRNTAMKWRGHLMYPNDFKVPIQLQAPVGRITRE